MPAWPLLGEIQQSLHTALDCWIHPPTTIYQEGPPLPYGCPLGWTLGLGLHVLPLLWPFKFLLLHIVAAQSPQVFPSHVDLSTKTCVVDWWLLKSLRTLSTTMGASSCIIMNTLAHQIWLLLGGFCSIYTAPHQSYCHNNTEFLEREQNSWSSNLHLDECSICVHIEESHFELLYMCLGWNKRIRWVVLTSCVLIR